MNKDIINKVYIVSILILIFTLPFYISVPETKRRNPMQYDDLILQAIKKESRKKIKKLYEENEDYKYLQYSTPHLYAHPKKEMPLLLNQNSPAPVAMNDIWEKNMPTHSHSQPFDQQSLGQNIHNPVRIVHHFHRHPHVHSQNSVNQIDHQKQVIAHHSRLRFIQNFMHEQQAKAMAHFKQLMNNFKNWRMEHAYEKDIEDETHENIV